MNDLLIAILHRFLAVSPLSLFREDLPGYLLEPRQNVLPALVHEDILGDFLEGDGGELEGDPPSFSAVHSSAALAANAFGPFRFHPERLKLAGIGGFTSVRFEKRLPTGLPGKPPNLDFFATGPEGSVAVESKFTETAARRRARFAASYARGVERLAEASWRRMYHALVDDPTRYEHVDAAQLVKHYLGMRHSLGRVPSRKVLLYLFWEPAEIGDLPAFQAHRAEVRAFADEVADSEIEFVGMTYDALWEEWSEQEGWQGMEGHVAALRARYTVRVPWG